VGNAARYDLMTRPKGI